MTKVNSPVYSAPPGINKVTGFPVCYTLKLLDFSRIQNYFFETFCNLATFKLTAKTVKTCNTRTSISCRWWTRISCIMANMLQTNVDAQCNKTLGPNWVDNTCDSRHFRVTASYLSNVANFNLPHLHLALPLGVTHSSFAEVFGIRKLESLGYRVALFAWSYV